MAGAQQVVFVLEQTLDLAVPDEPGRNGTPCRLEGPFGLISNPLTGKWSRSAVSDINYMMAVRAPTG